MNVNTILRGLSLLFRAFNQTKSLKLREEARHSQKKRQ